MECYPAVKKGTKHWPFAATWLELETLILSEERQISYDYHLYVNSNKNDTKELSYKTETNSSISKSNLWLPKGKC